MTDDDATAYIEQPDEFDDGSLRPTADVLRRALASGHPRPAFRDRLRAELVAARAADISAASAPAGPAPVADPPPVVGTASVPVAEPPPGAPAGERPAVGRAPVTTPAGPPGRTDAAGPATPRRTARASRRFGIAAFAAAVVVGVVVSVTVVRSRSGRPPAVAVTAQSDLSGAVSAEPHAPLRIRFSQPVNHADTVKALRLSPATEVSTSWQGDTLTVVPAHGFAPNSSYVLTVDHTRAHASTGAPLAADVRVAFGTAPVPDAVVTTPPLALTRTTVARAGQDSEAIIARDGDLLLTSAQGGGEAEGHRGLVRIGGGGAVRLSAATDAICLSRTGQSVAFLTDNGDGTRIVFADADGTPSHSVRATVDPGSPLGWIDDAKVSFISGGRLTAVDRDGHVSALSTVRVDAAHDTVAIAPGGRYAYVRPAAGGPGQLIDLATRASHPLTGISGDPAFSADGATVAWFTAAGGTTRVAVAPSGGGPVLLVPLPVQPGAQVSDLSLAPDGAHFAYSVNDAELRLAALASGGTVAVSTTGAGGSPNWSGSGRSFTVLASGPDGARIDLVTLPGRAADGPAGRAGLVDAFVDAQLSTDPGAQRALAEPGARLPGLPRFTRAAVLWVLPGVDGAATARVRLTADASPGSPVARSADETLVLAPPAGGGNPLVRQVTVGPVQPDPVGPRLVHLDTDTAPGTVRLVFGSDLDPGTVAGAIGLTGPDGRKVPSVASYAPATRTVTLRPAPTGTAGPVVVGIGTGLRDVLGGAAGTPLQIPLTLDR